MEQEHKELIDQAMQKIADLIRCRDYGTAKDILAQGLKTFPDCDGFYSLRGIIEAQLGNHEKAIEYYREAIRLNDEACHWNSLALSLAEIDRRAAAEDAYHRAIGLDPKYAPAYCNLANMLRHSFPFDIEASLVCLEKGLSYSPDVDYLWFGKGNTLGEMGRTEEAIEAHKRAVELSPETPDYHFNLGASYALAGRWTEAWPELDWRAKLFAVHLHKQQALNQFGPEWKGEDLKGKRIYLYCVQGAGDKIQFVRFAQLLKDRGAHVIVETPDNLKRLFKRIDFIDELAPQQASYLYHDAAPGQVLGCHIDKETLPSFDYHCEMMSLPGLLGITPENVPNDPYIPCEPMGIANDSIKIGICWAGSKLHRNDKKRSCELRHFLPFNGVANSSLYSLQKEERPEFGVHDYRVIDQTAGLEDFWDTAQLIAAMDLVVTVDTSIAHLAGAMGKPVFIMLPYVPDWRWGWSGETTPWYPSAELFRQASPDSWGNIFPVAWLTACMLHGVGGKPTGLFD